MGRGFDSLRAHHLEATMNHAMNWNDHTTVYLLSGLGFLALCAMLAIIRVIVVYRRETRADGEKPSHEPHAGKTLGL